MDTAADISRLVTDPSPCLTELIAEYHRAGLNSNGAGNIDFCESTRRMRWPGQSPDGRKWDRNLPEGEPAMPWDGCSDTKVPTVDEIINEEVEAEVVGFRKADLRGEAVNAEKADAAGLASTYLHWLVRSKMRKQLKLEVELSAQYPREYSWCAAYVGWEREISRKRMKVKLQQLIELAQFAQQARLAAMQSGQPQPGFTPEQLENYAQLPQMLMDPSRDAMSAEIIRDVYQFYVQAELKGKGFYEQEMQDENLLYLAPGLARKYVKALREKGEVEVPLPYVCKNGPVVYVLKPWVEILVPKGTVELQKARVIFWRRRMSVAELELERGNWNSEWIDAAKKTAGQLSNWATTITQDSLSPREIGGVTYTPVQMPGDDHVEVILAFVRKVDEDGVSSIYTTVFSPHFETDAQGNKDFVAKHEAADLPHGRYPFIDRKREHLGRGLEETRGIPEIANTWQGEEKNQRDMLFNRAQLDTLPPVRVPKMGGIDFRLGPAAQIPMGRADELKAIDLGGKPPTLAVELLDHLEKKKDNYFSRISDHVPAVRAQTHQIKMFGDFTDFWSEVFLMSFALSIQYNPAEVARVCGVNETELGIDAGSVMDELDCAIEFDIRELNPDYLTMKMDALNAKILPDDAAGIVDRAKFTQAQMRMVDPLLARSLLMDKGAAGQKVFRDVQNDFALMSDGQEPNYGADADPTAPMKLQFAQTIIQNNPKYQARLSQGHQAFDADFAQRVQNYFKNIQFNTAQIQNKQTGRLGAQGGAQMLAMQAGQ